MELVPDYKKYESSINYQIETQLFIFAQLFY